MAELISLFAAFHSPAFIDSPAHGVGDIRLIVKLFRELYTCACSTLRQRMADNGNGIETLRQAAPEPVQEGRAQKRKLRTGLHRAKAEGIIAAALFQLRAHQFKHTLPVERRLRSGGRLLQGKRRPVLAYGLNLHRVRSKADIGPYSEKAERRGLFDLPFEGRVQVAVQRGPLGQPLGEFAADAAAVDDIGPETFGPTGWADEG